MWRKYRDSLGLNSDDEADIRREIIAQIPERKPKPEKIEFRKSKIENIDTLSLPKELIRQVETNNEELSLARISKLECLSLTQRTPSIKILSDKSDLKIVDRERNVDDNNLVESVDNLDCSENLSLTQLTQLSSAQSDLIDPNLIEDSINSENRNIENYSTVLVENMKLTVISL